MQDITREQEARITALAIDHDSVRVKPQADGTVQVDAGGRVQIINPDGEVEPAAFTDVPLRVTLDMLRRLLGNETVDLAVAEARDGAYPNYRVARLLAEPAAERIDALIATRDALAESM